ncbi:helix-turn-helix domain-containing protein [Streptomyces sp. NPDC087843]|uniref:helix-turn-helix domain-containing protein n=1 Tax=Streptomyces sp. NPDC087843 TaxID=3365804 RepID=UPI0038230277
MSAWDTGSRADDGGTVLMRDDVEEFAALLRQLKDRTGRSYGSLARRLNMNTSTLHRYCAGEAVPQDFAPVERLAAFCEAGPEERLELHRLWLAAVAARQRVRVVGSSEAAVPAAAPVPAPVPDTDEVLVEEEDSAEQHGDSPDLDEPAGSPSPRPWYRRRRVLATTAVTCVLLATLRGTSALSDNRSSEADASRTEGPRTTAPGAPHRSAKPSVSDSPFPAPSTAAPNLWQKTPAPSATGSGATSAAKPATGLPLAWSADSLVWDKGCDHDYVIDKPPAQVPPPPAEQDARAWAARQGAVHGRQTKVRISVQGRSSTAVVLEALRVRIVSRGDPATGSAYAMGQGCGSDLSPRRFTTNLDVDRPIVRPKDGADSGHTIPAAHFPYRVSAEDPEELLVDATTQTYDVRWYLEVDWSSQGRTGTIRVDDHGSPFHTTSTKGMPRYWYGTNDADRRAWVPYDS